MKYIRPEVNSVVDHQLKLLAGQMGGLSNQRLRIGYIYALLVENAVLTAEINEHRCARGFDLLPTFDTTGARNGQ